MEDVNLIKGRSKRATAGNRMQALLASEFQAEEAFMEVENDGEFVAKDEADVFDEDFQDTDEEEGQDDAFAGEKDLQKEQREAQKVERLRKSKRALIPRLKLKLKTPGGADAGGTRRSPTKKRKVALGKAVDAATGAPVVRTSKRDATVQRTLLTKARLKEAKKKKASTPKRQRTAIEEKTQDTLIREALELEERNTQALKAFLDREEDKKKQARVVKINVEPPFLRWISRAESTALSKPTIEVIDTTQTLSAPVDPVSFPPPTTLPNEWNMQHSAPLSEESEVASPGARIRVGCQQTTVAAAAAEELMAGAVATSVSSDATTPVFSENNVPSKGRRAGATPRETPALNDRASAALKETRNYVVLELPERLTTPRETEMIFGKHTDWSRHALAKLEEARQRAQAFKNPTCAITGLTAPYLDPHSGVPYANAKAYKVLSRLLHHEYVWSQGMGLYANDDKDQGATGVPSEWGSMNQNGATSTSSTPRQG